MTIGRAWSVALTGLQADLVEIEATETGGLPRTVLVGLPDAALHENRDRVRAAVANSRLPWPQQALTINLTPAGLPKSGTHFDLGIAAATLVTCEAVPADSTRATVFLGELGLDGRVRRVRGLLPALCAARAAGFIRAVVPASQAGEAGLVDGLTVWGVATLLDVVDVLHGRPVVLPTDLVTAAPDPIPEPDLADVVGQAHAKWCLEVAAAGRHHLFLHGPPGVGKSMLAARLPSLLPDLTSDEGLEVAQIHSLAGLPLGDRLPTRPPYAEPHHSASVPSIVGGGHRAGRPGAISLAHRGVLVFDEAAEFPAKVLDALRTPLESGVVTISRVDAQVSYPARFQLVMASNPCPCGQYGSRSGTGCTCSPMVVRRYASRISGPILDRIDITHQLAAPARAFVTSVEPEETSMVVAARVAAARDRQARRLKTTPWRTNGEVPGPYLRSGLPVPKGMEMVQRSLDTGRLTARGVDKLLRVAWTLADLDGVDVPDRGHLTSALMLRTGEDVSGRVA